MSSGKQSEHYLEWKQGLREISVAKDIINAADGTLEDTDHPELEELQQSWGKVKREIKEIERTEDLDEIHKFVRENNDELERVVAYLIGSYLIAEDALEKMIDARESAPNHIADSLETERYKDLRDKIGSAASNKLSKIDKGVRHIDKALKQKYRKTGGNERMREEINFFEDIAQSVEQFKESGTIDEPMRSQVKGFVRKEIHEIKEREKQKRQKSRRAADDQGRGWGSFR